MQKKEAKDIIVESLTFIVGVFLVAMCYNLLLLPNNFESNIEYTSYKHFNILIVYIMSVFYRIIYLHYLVLIEF